MRKIILLLRYNRPKFQNSPTKEVHKRGVIEKNK